VNLQLKKLLRYVTSSFLLTRNGFVTFKITVTNNCIGTVVTVLKPGNVNVVVVLYFVILTANVCPFSRMMTYVYTRRFPKYISTYSYSARYTGDSQRE
jgi:hypothetical protein